MQIGTYPLANVDFINARTSPQANINFINTKHLYRQTAISSMQGYAHIYQHNLAHYKQSKQKGSARITANVSLTSVMLLTHMASFRAGLTLGQPPTVCTHQL